VSGGALRRLSAYLPLRYASLVTDVE